MPGSALVLLYPLQPQLILEAGHDLTCSVMIEPGLFVSSQPPRAASA
jgi:hypothetical protein